MNKFILIFLCFFSFLSAYDQTIEEALKKYQVPGVAVAIVTEDEVLLCKGYGDHITEHTLFGIGSCTKAFTALVLEQLIDEGYASWDDTVVKFLPDFCLYDPALTEQVTLLDLIAHRTAISRNDPLWVLKECKKEQVLKLLPHFAPAGEFRKSYVYNNFMYAVAGLVIEAITERTWEEEVSTRILEPLGMYDTKFGKFDAMLPACGISSTAHDMAKWLQLHLKAEIENERYQAVHHDYAKGWMVDNGIVFHGGLVEGFVSELLLLPQEKLGIAILTNSSKRGHFVVSAILKELLDMPFSQYPTEAMPPIGSLSHPISDYSGIYTHPAYGEVTISEELELSYGNQKIELQPTTEDCFVGRVDALVQFGMPSFVPFTFVRTGNSIELHIPFEGFYDPSPIVFTKILADG